MLCLNTANNDGRLITNMNEIIIPYNIEKIVRDTKFFDFDTVAIALDWYKKLGLIYEEENHNLRISNFEDMIGYESKWAEYKRKERKLDNVQIESKISPTDVQQEIEIEKENRDESIDIDKDNKLIIIQKDDKLSNSQLESEFEALRHYKVSRRNGTTYDEVLIGITNYLEYIQKEKIENQYIKHGGTWFNQECWNDSYLSKKYKTLKDISMEEIDNAINIEKKGIIK